jgi:hypothetical protein
MEVTASPSVAHVPLTLAQVIMILIDSIEGYWGGKLRRARRTMALGARMLLVSQRIEALLARFEAGEILWRGRRPRRAAEPVGKVPAAEADEEKLRGPYRLPSAYGWLAEAYPQTAIYYGPDLIMAMKQPQMQALMRATPEVARLMRPIFRMLALEDDVLLVPEGYDDAPGAAVPVAETRSGGGDVPDMVADDPAGTRPDIPMGGDCKIATPDVA